MKSTPVTTEGTPGKERVDGGGGSREDTEEDDKKERVRGRKAIIYSPV